jgi:hypothetical protein
MAFAELGDGKARLFHFFPPIPGNEYTLIFQIQAIIVKKKCYV